MKSDYYVHQIFDKKLKHCSLGISPWVQLRQDSQAVCGVRERFRESSGYILPASMFVCKMIFSPSQRRLRVFLKYFAFFFPLIKLTDNSWANYTSHECVCSRIKHGLYSTGRRHVSLFLSCPFNTSHIFAIKEQTFLPVSQATPSGSPSPVRALLALSK